MSISVDLHRDVVHQGGTTFRTVPASHPSDYECKPEGVLSYCDLEVGRNGDGIVVRLGKHRVLDELTEDNIGDELLKVADRPDCDRLLLDLSEMTQLSSAMLAKLLKLRRKMESKGEKLRLCGVNPQLRSVLATTRLDRIFDITDNEAGAGKAVAFQPAPFAEAAI